MPVAKQTLLSSIGTPIFIAGGLVCAYLMAMNRTIEDNLISRNVNLISTDEEYEVAFKELKDKEEFIEDIKKFTSGITKESNFSDGASALKKWCEKTLGVSARDKSANELTQKAKEYCAALPTTAKSKLLKNNYKPVTDWENKLEELKEDKDGVIKNDLSQLGISISDLKDTSQKAIIVKALQKWCGSNMEFKLNAEKDDTTYKKVKERCFDKPAR